MRKKTIRTGIAGAGFAGTFHFESLRKVYCADVEVVGVYDTDRPKAAAYAAKRGVRAFDSLEEMLDAVDVVHVCVPPVAHEPVAVAALQRDKFAVVEKPLTGYFGDGSDDFNGDRFDKHIALDAALASVERMRAAEAAGKGRILYAENWVYTPSIQKEREIVEKTGAQILWMHGEESHSGSHAATYGYWKFSGGGSLIGKGCHPGTGALYLKCVEGMARDGKPIRPKSVSARTAALTRLPGFRNEGHIRCDYHDIEDFSMMHITFEDGTVATIFAADVVVGGIHNWLEVVANNHHTMCNIIPNSAMQAYNPVEKNFADIYVTEKLGTKQGWSNPSPDEDWVTGYPQEMEAFYRTIALGEPPQSDSRLAADAISTLYSAYVSAQKGGAEVAVRAF
jgi:predicted dehydrogenase